MFLRSELTMSLVRTFTARGITSLGGAALLVVLGRLYGTEGVGIFALAQSLLMAAALFSRYGMDNALMRFVGRNPQSSHVYAYLRRAAAKSLLISTIAGIILFLAVGFGHKFSTRRICRRCSSALP